MDYPARLVYERMSTEARPARGEGGGQGEQNTWGPECSEGPGNLGKMFVYCLSSAISRGAGARVHKSSFCPGARGWLSPALYRSLQNDGFQKS